MPNTIRDNPGPAHEKRGNAVWVECSACKTWFPVSAMMQRPGAAPTCCPHCHHEEQLVAGS